MQKIYQKIYANIYSKDRKNMSNVLHQIKTSESEQTRLLELAQLNRLNPHEIANVALDHFLASLASVTAAKPYFYASPCSATLKPYWISKGNNSN